MRSYQYGLHTCSDDLDDHRAAAPATQSHCLFRALAPDTGRIRVVNAYANAVNRPVRRTGVDLAEVTVLDYQFVPY